MERSYEEAISCLNSRKASAKPNLNDMRGSDDMVEWLQLLGHSNELQDLNGLNVIHIAGTKGKGSTCAFAASILNAHGKATGYPEKVGLYTSPHMISIRERICINGRSISKKQFTTHFFNVWDKLPKKATPSLDIPRYLQLLALLSFHVFLEEKVDVAVFEAHAGGEFDATNVVTKPVVTAVTSVALDHIKILGPTIEDIAWHKAGIFKAGSYALSTRQEPEVTAVLKQRATEKGVELEHIGIDSNLPENAISLKPEVQKWNCSLALAVVRVWLLVRACKGCVLTESDISCGIEQYYWPGRYERIVEDKLEWFLDGAHNIYSLSYAVDWFVNMVEEKQRNTIPRILIFSHFSGRDGTELLRCIATSMAKSNIRMQYVILSSYDERLDGQARIDRNLRKRFSQKVQEQYAKAWQNLDPTAIVLRERTIEGALNQAREIGMKNGMQALITGSLHLVSGALCLLKSDL